MKNRKVSVVGLGYVGLPVAVAFGMKAETIGFDINEERVNSLLDFSDCTNEVSSDELRVSNVRYTFDPSVLALSDFYIVAVPTPVDQSNQPDFTALISVSSCIGKTLSRGDIVVYESTVYPGATEDICIPVLERESGLKSGKDFKVGYSPERINPGDKEHTFTKIRKVVSAQDEESLEIISDVYSSVVEAGVYRAASIKVAEAAKVIENTQRDINIALMNELAIIFDRVGVDTSEVLKAAGTKWNFLKFYPGLVGGHCIGVDPYYLTSKAEQLGYTPQVILSGRRINDGMAKFVAEKTVKEMIQAGHSVKGSTVTILGLTFKENCPDLRNTKVVDVIAELESYGVVVQVHEPMALKCEAKEYYGIDLVDFEKLRKSEAVIGAVSHDFYCKLNVEDIANIIKPSGIIIDVKGFLRNKSVDIEASYWQL